MSQFVDNPRSRWIELGITLAASIITSALVMSWRMSASLAQFQDKLDSQEMRLERVESQAQQNSSANSTQNSEIAVQSSQWSEVIRRLDAIDRKLEKR